MLSNNSLAEVVGGLISRSLSLISDTTHIFSDGIAIINTYIAMQINKQFKTLMDH